MKRFTSFIIAQGYIRLHPDWVIMQHPTISQFAVGPVEEAARMERLGWVRIA